MSSGTYQDRASASWRRTTMTPLPEPVAAALLAMVAAGQTGSVTVHFCGGEPKTVERRIVESAREAERKG